MDQAYVLLLDLGIGFVKQFIASVSKNKAPQQILDAGQALLDAITAHKDDVVNKANLETQRG